MQPIPRPELLDPDRLLSDDRDDMTADEHRNRANQLAGALEDSCRYAQQLWDELQAVREYLVRSLPDDPQRPEARRTETAPAGPDDEAGWHDWIGTYAAVTSVLCGPHGDSGFGADEAREQARARRAAPVPVLPRDALRAAGGTNPRPREPWWRFWRR
jgi:hypothetical protein